MTDEGFDVLLLEDGCHFLLETSGKLVLEHTIGGRPGGIVEPEQVTKRIGHRLLDYEPERRKKVLNTELHITAQLAKPIESPFRIHSKLKERLIGKIEAVSWSLSKRLQSSPMKVSLVEKLEGRFEIASKLKRELYTVKLEAKLDFTELQAKIERYLRQVDPHRRYW